MWGRSLNTFSIAIGAAALLYLTFFNVSESTTFFATDQATDFHIANALLEGEYTLLGPPSHIGGRHMGPLYYWFVTGAYLLAGKNLLVANLIFSLAKLAGAALLLFLLQSLLPENRRAVGTLGALIALCGVHYVEVFRMQWQSHFLIISSSIAVFGSVYAIRYGPKIWALPLFCLTFLAHSHLSSAPVVISLGLAILGCWIFKKSYKQPNWKITTRDLNAKLLIISLALWFPILLHELYFPSNYLKLLTLHGTEKTAEAGSIIAGSLVFEFIAHYIMNLKFTVIDRTWWDTVAFFSFVLIFFSGVFSSKRRMELLLILTPFLGSLLLLRSFRPPLYLHYLNSSIALPIVVSAVLWSESIGAVYEIKKNKLLQKFMALPALIVLVYLVLYAPASIGKAVSRNSDEPHRSFHTLAHAREMSELIKDDVEDLRTPKIFTRMAAKSMLNSYYLFFDHPPFHQLDYHEFFHEIPRFNYPLSKRANDGYVVFCPSPYTQQRNEMLNPLLRRWRLKGELDLSGCESCRSCRVVKLERIKKR